MGGGKALQQVGQQACGDGGQPGYGQPPSARFEKGGEILGAALGSVHQTLSEFREGAPLLGWGDVGRVPVEEPRADPRLEPRHQPGQRRRRHAKMFGREAERARIRQRQHGATVGQVEFGAFHASIIAALPI